ncbi:MAG: helicase, partial [Oscillospiraceae bacterium]|nr:helicase [Oscillospiraceae bacterium]
MLRFILGRAGTGKTTELTEHIRARVQAGGSVILLVPEQYSFESERRLYRLLGPRGNLSVQVLSFTRLCDNIFRRFGGLAGMPVTKPAKYLLMSAALAQLEEELTVYRKSAVNIGFVETMLNTCSEFKTAGITPAQLLRFARSCEPGGLGGKLSDLCLVYGTYQAMLEKGYTDAEDNLIRACELLENNDFFDGTDVCVDGFTTFMAAEFELISHIITHARSITVALTADSSRDES